MMSCSGYIIRNNNTTSKSTIRRSDHKKVKTNEKVSLFNRNSLPLRMSRPKNVQSFGSELISRKKISMANSNKPLTEGDFDFEPFFPNYRQESSTRPPVPEKPDFQMQVEESDMRIDVQNTWDRILDTKTVVAGIDVLPKNAF